MYNKLTGLAYVVWIVSNLQFIINNEAISVKFKP